MDKKLLFGYVAAAIALFFYSYTQVDLSLTLFANKHLPNNRKKFSIHRLLSAAIVHTTICST